jgi:hypothetical protein
MRKFVFFDLSFAIILVAFVITFATKIVTYDTHNSKQHKKRQFYILIGTYPKNISSNTMMFMRMILRMNFVSS